MLQYATLLPLIFSTLFLSGGVSVLSNAIIFGKSSQSLQCLLVLKRVCECKAIACDDMRRASLMPTLVNSMKKRDSGSEIQQQRYKSQCNWFYCTPQLTSISGSPLSIASSQLLKAMIVSSKANASAFLFYLKLNIALMLAFYSYVARQQGSVVAAAEIISYAALNNIEQSDYDTAAASAAADVLFALCSASSPEAAQVI
jgi:hypothetical protein